MWLRAAGQGNKQPKIEKLSIIENGSYVCSNKFKSSVNTQSGWNGLPKLAPTLSEYASSVGIKLSGSSSSAYTGSGYIQIDLTNYKTLNLTYNAW